VARSNKNTAAEQTLAAHNDTLGAVVLAAGFSVRFGSIKLKAVLPDGTSLLQKTFNNILQITDNIVIIGRAGLLNEGVYDFLAPAQKSSLVLCEEARHGMGHSLACAIKHVPAHWQSVLICLGDMPFVRQDTLKRLLISGNPQQIIIPTYLGARGHPVNFGRYFFSELQMCDGDSGGRHVLKAYQHAITELETDDSGILQDIDTPQALAELGAQVTRRQ